MPILDNFESQYISIVSEDEPGLMSSFDKLKLDGLLLDDINYINNKLQDIKEYQEPQFIYGIKIDPNNPDPDKCVTYTDDAIGFIPLKVNLKDGLCDYGSWKDIIDNVFGIRPVLMRSDGQVVSQLDPNNYSKTTNGNSVDISSGNMGQVMIRFKHLFYKFLVEEGKIWFRVSNKQIDHTWIDTAFTSEDGIGTSKDEMFISAYESVQKNYILQSVSGSYPTVNLEFELVQKYSSFGVFHMMNIVRKQFITFLGYLVTKSIDLKTNIGKGNTGGSVLKTGSMNTKGLFYGKDNSREGVKMFGIENLWGNSLKYMNGIIQRYTPVFNKETNEQEIEQHLYIKEFYPYDKIYNFTDIGKIDEDIAGYIASIRFVSDSIYLPDKLDGASNIYFKSYFQNGKSKNPNNKLYGIYGGDSSYGSNKVGPEFLLLADPDPASCRVTTHIIY